jgi:hypothetical protein
MTYVATGNIQATDYNGFVSTTSGGNLNATWGDTATVGQGYGQGNIATVAVGSTVTATQWSTLFSTIANIAAHQGSPTTITSRTPYPVATNTIYANAGVATDLATCYTNRANAASVGTQFTGWSGTSSKTGTTGSGGSAWTISWTHVITFANTAAYYSFFNAGGTLKWYISKNSTGTVADTEWNSFVGFGGAGGVCSGNIVLTGSNGSKTINGVTYTGTTKFGGSGSPATYASGTGVYSLTTGQTTLYQQNDPGGAYTSNYVRLNAAVNSTSAPTTLTLYTTWYDAGDGNPGSTAQISGGSASSGISFGSAPTTIVTLTPPEQTNIANVWSSQTIVASVA